MKGERLKEKVLLRNFVLGLVCLVLISLLVNLQPLENLWLDFLLSLRFFSKGLSYHQEPIIIQIDDDSIHKLGPWPWPRSIYADALKVLENENPAVVAFDLLFQMPDPENDQIFLETLENTKFKLVLGMELELNLIEKFWSKKWVKEKEKASLFTSVPQGYLNLLADQDGLFRRWPLPLEIEELAFVEQIYKEATKEEPAKIKRGIISFQGTLESFPTISFYQLLKGDYPPNYFKNKIILVGVTRQNIDHHGLALSALGNVPGVYLHAYLLRNLLDTSWLVEMPSWASFLLVLLVMIFGFSFLKNQGTSKILIWTLVTMVVFFFLGLIFAFKGYILPIPTILILLSLRPLLSLLVAYHKEIKERQEIKGLFSKYVSPEIMQEILEHRDEIKVKGERRFVAVFFADLREFTKFSQEKSPEEVIADVNQILGGMAEVVRKYGGFVNKFLGDGIMAIFGIPIWEEDLLEKTFNACQEILQRKQEIDKQGLKIGIGLSWGEAVAGSVGSSKRMEYTVMGSPVNLAARLEELAQGGELVFSIDSHCQGKPWLKAYELEEVEVKGMDKPVQIGRIKIGEEGR